MSGEIFGGVLLLLEDIGGGCAKLCSRHYGLVTVIDISAVISLAQEKLSHHKSSSLFVDSGWWLVGHHSFRRKKGTSRNQGARS